jgi:hypothetical protein
VPAVVVDGQLLAYGHDGGVDEAALRLAIAQPERTRPGRPSVRSRRPSGSL